jgi:BlaI family transcriptional regulator, penicillinase repressor
MQPKRTSEAEGKRRPEMTDQKNLPDLSPAEWNIMKKVWELRKTNVREVYEELKGTQGWAYNTVRTMMERLREKGYLETKEVGNTYFYQPAASRRSISLAALRRFADKVFDGAVGPVVSYLIQEEKLSDEEKREIKQLLDGEKKDKDAAFAVGSVGRGDESSGAASSADYTDCADYPNRAPELVRRDTESAGICVICGPHRIVLLSE